MRKLAVLVLLVVACKSGGSKKDTNPVDKPPVDKPPPSFVVDLTGYDLTCAADADCVMVETSPCDTKCTCPQHSISTKAMDRYHAAVAAIDCTKAPTHDDIVCGECMSPLPACVSGTCSTKNPP
jgi:hypothetical protein